MGLKLLLLVDVNSGLTNPRLLLMWEISKEYQVQEVIT